MEGNEKDELDGLIDDALRSYAPEPRAGIEGRILSRVRVEGRHPRRFPWLPFAVAIPALLLLVLVFPGRPPQTPRHPAPVVVSHVPVLVTSALTAVAKPRRLKPKPGVLRRADQFPTPSPLTPEEQALARFASAHPEETHDLIAGQSEPEPAPIEIQKLQIPPLSISGEL